MIWSLQKSFKVLAGVELITALSSLNLKGEILLISSSIFGRNGTVAQTIESLQSCNVQVYAKSITNPDLAQIRDLALSFANTRFDTIIALGGGSIIDTAKALSVVLLEPDGLSALDCLSLGKEFQISGSIPIIAIPSTSGTGAECTQFATLWDLAEGKKYSLESPHLLPQQIILDPQLTVTLPRAQTLYTGLDALSHATESLWNKNFNPLAKACAKEAIGSIVENLPTVLEQPKNLIARTEMQNASFLAGIAISQTKTAIAHAISYPLTYRYLVPHGLAAAFSIPALFRFLKSRASLDKDSYKSLKLSAKFIESLQLSNIMKTYLSQEELISLVGEMANPQRFANFILSVSADELRGIVMDSYQDFQGK
jgi:alcohol dehydrogenase